MITTALIFSVASALAMLLLLLKLNLRRVLGYDVAVDIVVSMFLIYTFKGTVTGMAAAMLAGCTISLVLYITKQVVGYERLQWHNRRFHWASYRGAWRWS